MLLLGLGLWLLWPRLLWLGLLLPPLLPRLLHGCRHCLCYCQRAVIVKQAPAHIRSAGCCWWPPLLQPKPHVVLQLLLAAAPLLPLLALSLPVLLLMELPKLARMRG